MLKFPDFSEFHKIPWLFHDILQVPQNSLTVPGFQKFQVRWPTCIIKSVHESFYYLLSNLNTRLQFTRITQSYLFLVIPAGPRKIPHKLVTPSLRHGGLRVGIAFGSVYWGHATQQRSGVGQQSWDAETKNATQEKKKRLYADSSIVVVNGKKMINHLMRFWKFGYGRDCEIIITFSYL